ncbi:MULTISPECIES: VWA domain-containing protein [Nocardia]|uniref:VWA domain-containing protein n=6 Tax=Nocardia TaxID=1817 RepID=A0A7G1KFE4_9NOCA|nr:MULTISPECIES: VWA domain-containing protein [Nocardia]MBF6259818.1 VWA domain-containing protein [Nocardia farcinica]MBF6271375.1 VWA domain-containing protein [Nocardia farcinica]MBF6295408.1 VWA domain-containing protein [Nocardia farcinica]MBF6362303.1 VWA domain-containing protein [Nocardia farcinica]MBF6376630.1 VWA domain-containing protein [Nocardia farcinica]
MTGHLIADPTTTPTPPPATAGWDALSAALTDEAPPIADRDDLVVTIAPGAAHGHPAVFMPHSAAIEIDGTRLGIDPATARPDRNSDRARYAAVWGAFVHECAHAQHSVWEAPPVANPAVVEAALLLEESRIEAAQIRRRPDDRHWLRASATEIVIGDNGGTDAAAQIPPTDYAAAHNAALLLGRVDGGILTASECAPAAGVIESILGSDKLEKLRAIWQQAHTVADDDTNTMLELGQRWLDIVGPDPHADPDPNSVLSAAIGDTVTNISNAVAAQPVPVDPAEAAATAQREAQRAARRAAARAQKVFGNGNGTGTSASTRATRTPHPDERAAARVLARALNNAAQRERATIKTTSALPPGRLRMRGALAREAQRAAGALPTAEPFTRTTRKTVPIPPLRVGIACDVSGSMSDYADPVASAAWIIARAAELATMPAATATVTFGASVAPITYPGTAPARVTQFSCPDFLHAIDNAIEALDGALELSRPENTRLLVIISDGYYDGSNRDRAQKLLDRLRATGCAVLWLAPDTGTAPDPLNGANLHLITDPATTAHAIGRAATAAVRTA